ncbi:MAG: hypothetical protein ACKVP0_20330 [Pirellulaceae bacterium]
MKLFHSSSLEGGRIPKLPQREIPAASPEVLQNNMHRHFDPTPGQWLSEEPLSFAADPHNLHPYVIPPPVPPPSR